VTWHMRSSAGPIWPFLAASACLLIAGCDSSSDAVEISNRCSFAVKVYVGESNEVSFSDPNELDYWAQQLDLRGSPVGEGDVKGFPIYDGAPGYVVVYGRAGADVQAEWRPISDRTATIRLSEEPASGECVADDGVSRAG